MRLHSSSQLMRCESNARPSRPPLRWTPSSFESSGPGVAPHVSIRHFGDTESHVSEGCIYKDAVAGPACSLTHPFGACGLPGHVASVSLGVHALRANIGSKQGNENHQPRADEDHACDDVGSPMHTQLNP